MSDAPTRPVDVASDIEILLQEKTLQLFEPQLTADAGALKSNNIPTRKGDIIEWTRLLLPEGTSSELTASAQPEAERIYSMDVRTQAKEYGQKVQIERIVELTSKHIQIATTGAKAISKMAAKTADALMVDLLAQNAYRIRADGDSTYQVNVTTTSDGNAGGTTFVSTSLTGTPSFVGGYATITGVDSSKVSREAIHETRKISAQSTSTITVDTAFSSQIKSGCTVHLCVGTGIVATDKLTTDIFAKACTRLTLNDAWRFDGQPGQNLPPKKGQGGYWMLFYDANVFYDFMRDVDWVATGQYQAKEQLERGLPAPRWMNVEFHGTTRGYREDVDGTKNLTSGAVHVCNFVGQEAYGISQVMAPGAAPPYGLVTSLMTSKDLGQTVPRFSEAGYIMYFGKTSLCSMWNIAVLAGATDVA